MAVSVTKLDEFVKEYLLYRGLVSTSRQLDTELKNEKEKQFRVDRIMDTLHGYITAYDLASLREYWQFLDQRLFSRLESGYGASVRKLETSILKLYVVTAVQTNKSDKVTEFFEKLTPELQGQTEWREWFVLPFVKNPEENRTFAMYFTRQWQDTMFLTLHNFLSVIIRSMALPAAFEFEDEARKTTKLQEENTKYKQILADLKDQKTFTHTLGGEDSIASTPIGPPPGPNSMDLMDDFFVISQDSPIVEKTTTANLPKTQGLKSFIKNITIPSSPIMGRKTPSSSSGNNSKLTGAVAKLSSMAVPSVRLAAGGVGIGAAGGTGSKVGQGTPASSSQQSPSLGRKEDLKQKPKVIDSQTKPKTKAGFVVTSTPIAGATMATKADPTSSQVDAASQDDGALAGSNVEDDRQPLLLLNQEEYSEHRSCITHCRFNVTGQKVATSDMDGVVKVWNPQPAPLTEATTISKTSVLALDWIKADKLLLGSKAGNIRVYDITEKKTIKEATVDPAHPRVASLCSSPLGTHFVCSTVGRTRGSIGAPTGDAANLKCGKLAVWDLRTMKIERGLQVSPISVAMNWTAYNHNGQLIITAGADGNVRLFDARKGDCISSWMAHKGEVYSVMFSHDETGCYSMGSDSKLHQWSLHKTGHLLQSLPIHAGACGPFVLTGHGGYRQVQTPKGKLVSLGPTGEHILTCAHSGAQIYRLLPESGMLRNLHLGGHRTPVVAADWAPGADCNMCVTGSMDGKVRVSTLLTQ